MCSDPWTNEQEERRCKALREIDNYTTMKVGDQVA